MECRLCTAQAQYVFSGKALGRHEVRYYLCGTCDLLQTEQPYWLDEAYASPLSICDTSAVARNIAAAFYTAPLLYYLSGESARAIDYGGGSGLFTRLMRDIGFDFRWLDLFAGNVFARGFEWQDTGQVDLVTSFECVEHLVTPGPDFDRMISMGCSLLISTTLRPELIPDKSWHYYGFEHGQHIAFFSSKTLCYVASRRGRKVITCRDFHLLCDASVSESVVKAIYRARKLLFVLVKQRMCSLTGVDSDAMRDAAKKSNL